ncbi:alanine racemase [Arcobacter porcinus]|uniref:Alanine racemase n=1 Tax=Arcobacter porcinus TaxID=1935204 RepID=A0A1C0B0E9_9BACT|nr:alanine racemase [Arcobacter porcinus]OCL91433.1 Alanine racemase [Aliarcobacter thereius]OCL93335.1 Alanine racemase [Arcobacter porcinus]QEP40252.1 alanine racemase [Arcobacter porcinus]
MAKILLDKNKLFYNLEIISNKATSKDKVAVVLKDNAYGHGLVEIAKLASEFGIKKAVVRTIKDAQKIEEFFPYILVLADTSFHNYSHTFHIAINSLEDIKKVPEKANVHLKIDTGMHRNGISYDEIEDAIFGLLKQKATISGVFTHHRGADNLSTDFFWQNENFNKAKAKVKKVCEKLFLPLPAFHSCNSSALFRKEFFDEDFARVGIATYGYLDNSHIFNFPKLKPVMSLWANKMATRTLEKGQSIGYGGKFTADSKMLVSTYDIGYGDGFLRLDGKTPYLTPKNYNILGRVSMDNLSINSDDDEVCIFDDVTKLAEIHNTISYEITCSLKDNIQREIVE